MARYILVLILLGFIFYFVYFFNLTKDYPVCRMSRNVKACVQLYKLAED